MRLQDEPARSSVSRMFARALALKARLFADAASSGWGVAKEADARGFEPIGPHPGTSTPLDEPTPNNTLPLSRVETDIGIIA